MDGWRKPPTNVGKIDRKGRAGQMQSRGQEEERKREEIHIYR